MILYRSRIFRIFLLCTTMTSIYVVLLSSTKKRDEIPWNSSDDRHLFVMGKIKHNSKDSIRTIDEIINKNKRDISLSHAFNRILKVQNSSRSSSSLSLLPGKELPYYSRYIINPSLLCGPDDFMIVYIHTAPENLLRRTAIRQTWGNKKLLNNLKIKLLFVMGVVGNRQVMDNVKLESGRYNDIFQSEFNDTYRNLNSKAMAALRWIATHCKNISYILKTDDDILVNIFQVVKHLRYLYQYKYTQEKFILCNVWHGMPVLRDKKSKWYVSHEEYRNETFEVYCSGSAYILSPDMPGRLLKMSLKVPRLWVDDVYVTGMLVNALGIKHTHYDSAYLFGVSYSLSEISKDIKRKTVFYHVPQTKILYKLWNRLNERMNASLATRNILK